MDLFTPIIGETLQHPNFRSILLCEQIGRYDPSSVEGSARRAFSYSPRRQGEMFTLIYGIWTFLFQVGVLALLSVIA
jgi:hypothetical protein